MTAKKVTPNAQLAAFMAAPNAAEAARVVGVDGKRFRSHLRGKLGAYASKGSGWSTLDNATRTSVFERFTQPTPVAK